MKSYLPAGESKTLNLRRIEPGRFGGAMNADVQGAYRVSMGDLTTIAAAGALNPREYKHIIPTADILGPLSTASGGGTFWQGGAGGLPSLRKVKPGAKASGDNFAGLIANEQYNVTNSRRTPFGPTWLYFIFILAALLGAWRMEGR